MFSCVNHLNLYEKVNKLNGGTINGQILQVLREFVSLGYTTASACSVNENVLINNSIFTLKQRRLYKLYSFEHSTTPYIVIQTVTI